MKQYKSILSEAMCVFVLISAKAALSLEVNSFLSSQKGFSSAHLQMHTSCK